MMGLEIKKYPDSILRQKCQKVDVFDKELKLICQKMIEIIKENQGIGLAAPQVGILKRIIVVDFDNNLKIFINPEILKKSKEKEIFEEGCLSFPGLFLKIKRPKEIEIKAQDLNGQEIKMKLNGLTARIFQHEVDHLDGILFIDRVGKFKKLALAFKKLFGKRK